MIGNLHLFHLGMGITLFFSSLPGVSAQDSLPSFEFVSNQGQWDEPFLFKTAIPGGDLFLEKNRMVYTFWDTHKKGEVMESLHTHRSDPSVSDAMVPAHGVYIQFKNSNPSAQIKGDQSASHYYNFYTNPDPQKWRGKVPVFRKVSYDDIYKGVDLHFYTHQNYLKYDFIVEAGANPNQIQLEYEGANSIKIREGFLQVETSVNQFSEQKPYAYQVINGEKKEVSCNFRIKKNTVSFELGKYDKNYALIIDPVLIFSTYSGSTRDNWGFTATYDADGNMYGGGIVFGTNTYPGTIGSFQLNFGGGQYDALICKFNPTGTTLMHYTYLGGAAADAPCSMVCNSQKQLYILGVTGSPTFPVTAGSFQPNFAGGPSTGIIALNGNDFPNGSDLFVCKLSEDGTVMLASTFVGGSGLDGINIDTTLKHNYADEFRGEIIVDANDQTYICSSSRSTNFPTVNAVQNNLNGLQDAVVCRFNSTLSNAIFSTYLGGNSGEAGYSIQLNSMGQIYVTGGTRSANFPTTAGSFHPNFMGGSVDGFLTRLSPTGNVIMNSTYLGTNSYDQSYAVQLDGNDDVYVVGQTKGNYPVTPGVYSNPNSGQFIQKLPPALNAGTLSTVFGRGVPGQIDIVPTAFLVDVCDHIYVAGWGGDVNASYGGGSTVGLPVTPNAFDNSTNGSDFYLFVMDDDMSGLLYATFYGGALSDEHVDGGTSRFDKNGIVYEAVCAGCGSHNDFPTTPNAWSTTNPSQNCNLGVFKFDVSDFTAIIDPQTPTTICEGGSITLHNGSTGGFPHSWDLGDGTTSTAQDVTHTYNTPGTYTVYLTVTAPNACITSDMDSIVITVLSDPIVQIQQVPVICPDSIVQLNATGADSYVWDASLYLSNLTIANPHANPPQTMEFYVTGTNSCGSDRDTITVQVVQFNVTTSEDDTICFGSSIQLFASGGTGYLWNNGTTLSNPTVSNPIATPLASTEYIVEVTSPEGCKLKDTVNIQVDQFPNANAGADQNLCLGDSYTFNGTGGTIYSWSPPLYLNNSSVSNPQTTPQQTVTYIMSASNTCGTDLDTVIITVIVVNGFISPDTIICPRTTAQLYAGGGVSYHWTPSVYVNQPNEDTVIVSPPAPTQFIAQIIDANGCSDFDTVFVDMYPDQVIELGPNVLIPFGETHQLHANGTGTYLWTPDSFLTCNTCPDPVARPVYSIQYVLTVTDSNGCQFQDSIIVFVEGSLYIPNTFTPNGDGMNEIFLAYGIDIREFTMRIFNRWGEELFETTSLHYGWDGNYRNAPCPLGVYVWKVDYVEVSGKEGTLIGHVNLLR